MTGARIEKTIKSSWHHPLQPPLAQLASQGLVDHPIGLSTAPAPVQSVHCAHRPVMYIHARSALAHTESAGGTHTPPLSSPLLVNQASPRPAESPLRPVADAGGRLARNPLEIRNSSRVEFYRICERNDDSRWNRHLVAPLTKASFAARVFAHCDRSIILCRVHVEASTVENLAKQARPELESLSGRSGLAEIAFDPQNDLLFTVF